ncbi:fimbria/pilus periplasmic chaperone [Enterobacter sp. Cy-643]|uniref:fimbria/pilus periplasmic chaperone n=1 Tax=Enterobacter sp. Cy-643 TaxID=2608346 RepID=UPI0014204C0C|nr:fimbria/pilus periplasmic chaperone [Enterobacter sp. Cy-643]NIF32460.1 fimbria/pilus periplasmic chaperone [Enterobacter sp. Cy-643]
MSLFCNNKIYSAGGTALAAAILISNSAIPVFAQGQKTVTNTKVFQVKLGASRVIYNPDSSGASLSVTNAQNYPILVQGKVFTEDKKTVAPFIITPPVSRLDAHQQSRLRIIRTGGQMAGDHETLHWLCVAGIPPKNTDVWAQDENRSQLKPADITLNLEVSANSCIKLLVRPSGVKGTVMDAASALKWQRQGNKMTVTNPSAFYMNLSSLSVGGMNILDKEYVAPRSSRSFTLPKGAAGQVKWSVITDEGGASRQFRAPL